MEEDYRTAIRQFYCRPRSPTSSHKSAAAVQPTSCLQGAAAEQATQSLQGAAAEQATQSLQGAAAEQATQSLQGAAAEQATQSLQGAAAEQATQSLKGAAAAAAVELSTPGLQPAAEFPGSPRADRLCYRFLRVPTDRVPGRTDAPSDPKSASTSPTCRRGRRKRSTSAQVSGGLGDASAAASSLQAFQEFSGELVPVLVPESYDEGFEEEASPDHVCEGFKEQLELVLAS
ncbi:hypothetical protein CRENBAI_011754 [Crenichthys baileyi]|uniref:Uncharacterized protein n=1 Tax=Crenichthys baileyi TaxID=28760 RepID=A0AAV9RYC9_9TELE